MSDPFADVVKLLQPTMAHFNVASAAGRWHVQRTTYDHPVYLVVLTGALLLTADGMEDARLEEGDFVLIPAARSFSMRSLEPFVLDATKPECVQLASGEWRIGSAQAHPDVRMLAGHLRFGFPDTTLLASLLPAPIQVRGEARLGSLARFVADEFGNRRPAREIVLAHLLELLLIEALRSSTDAVASQGLLRGLKDERLNLALRAFHEAPERRWSVAVLASLCAMSRSTFFKRFNEVIGFPPMEYVLAWRMALARNLLKHETVQVAEVAAQVGYSSPSTFSVAFTRHVGVTPGRFAAAARLQA